MAEVGHNSIPAEDAQRALAYIHKERVEKAERAKAKAVKELKKAFDCAKADGVGKDDLSILKQLETPEGEARFKAEMQRRIKVATWSDFALGTQFSFLDQPDRTPIEDRAFEEGKIAGFSGKDARTPEGYSGQTEQRWLEGHAEGSKARLSVLERATSEVPEPEKKSRGRPKGSKNKPKESFAEKMKEKRNGAAAH